LQDAGKLHTAALSLSIAGARPIVPTVGAGADKLHRSPEYLYESYPAAAMQDGKFHTAALSLF
jgi:hypothetical protein